MSYKRLLKSYVIRNKKLNASKLEKLDTLSKKYCVGADDIGDAFSDNKEVICDIGFGRGDSLLEQAQQYSEYNYLGAEVYTPGIINVLSNIESRQYDNIKLWHGDAVEMLDKLADSSLSRVQLLYPDPWPKARHNKRRIVSDDFVKSVVRVTKNAGHFYFVTDWLPYAEYVIELLENHPCLNRIMSLDATPNIRETKYATKGMAKGHSISELIYEVKKP